MSEFKSWEIGYLHVVVEQEIKRHENSIYKINQNVVDDLRVIRDKLFIMKENRKGEEMKFKPTTQTKHTYRIIFTDDEAIEVTCDSASITDEIFIGYDDGVMFFHCHMSKIKYFMKVLE